MNVRSVVEIPEKTGTNDDGWNPSAHSRLSITTASLQLKNAQAPRSSLEWSVSGCGGEWLQPAFSAQWCPLCNTKNAQAPRTSLGWFLGGACLRLWYHVAPER